MRELNKINFNINNISKIKIMYYNKEITNIENLYKYVYPPLIILNNKIAIPDKYKIMIETPEENPDAEIQEKKHLESDEDNPSNNITQLDSSTPLIVFDEPVLIGSVINKKSIKSIKSRKLRKSKKQKKR